MSECRDKRFENMLFAYELGILSDDERRELELHALECESCLEELKIFQNAALHIRHDEPTRQVIEEIAGDRADEHKKKSESSRIWRTLIPVAAAAVILLMLVLQPWQIEIKPYQEATAAEDRIVILNFENLADPSDSQYLGKIAANLLITDLSESHFIEVVSSQRLQEILKRLRPQDSGMVSDDIAIEAARTAGASWILKGSILRTAPRLTITTQIVDVATGKVINSRNFEGDSTSTIFSLVDELTVAVKSNLPIPDRAQSENDRSIADFTTHSADAYRYYLDGIDYYRKTLFSNSKRSFEQVIEYDSTFAMAYYYLAQLKDINLLDYAIKNIDRASEKDGYYIRALEAAKNRDNKKREAILTKLIERYPSETKALYLLGRLKYSQARNDEAIAYFEKTLSLDPEYKEAYNLLAYAYKALGKKEDAIGALNKYMAVAPNESNPYDTKGELFAGFGMLDSAIASYKRALEITPDFPSSLENLGVMYVFKEDYEKAAECFHKMASSESAQIRSQGRYYLALIPLYQGKIKQSLDVINDCMAADRLESAGTEQWYKHVIRAVIFEGINEIDSAYAEIEQASDAYLGASHLYYWILTLAGKGKQARQAVEEFREKIEDSRGVAFNYYISSGFIDYAEGSYHSAVNNLEKARDISDIFPVSYLLGQAYIKTERFEDAINILKKRLTIFDSYRVCRGTWSVKMYFYLGTAYEGAGRFDDARVQYERFLDLWQDADMPIPEILDAKERLARIKNI